MKHLLLLTALSMATMSANAQGRALWASVNNVSNASLGDYTQHNGKLLLSWRMLPGDGAETSFHIYRRPATSLNATYFRHTPATPVSQSTCYQSTVPTAATTYYLVPGNLFEGTAPARVSLADNKLLIRQMAVDSLTVGPNIYTDKLPYLSIPLQPTTDVNDNEDIVYYANDCSVGDLDGDGQMEIVVKRMLGHKSNASVDEGTGAGDSDRACRHTIIWDAYKLDGTLLWRIKSGPNIILGNSSNFGVADLDGDGKAEFVTRTSEGTVFGDGTTIGDTDNDGITDYRAKWNGHYQCAGPEFFSVCDGTTGAELARANFIDRGTSSESWGDNYWKRACSYRLGIASFDGQKNHIFLGRGVYARTVVEGWDFDGNQLTRLWHFDSAAAGGNNKNKDGKANAAYAGQGNHSFNVADLDGDGKDEVMYGSCAFDDDGTGLWSTQLGHGDANHVGKFLPEREGLQVFHCLESGTTQVALHDARNGAVIWKKVGSGNNDTGRCNVADIDPASPGCEFYFYQSDMFSQKGTALGYNTAGWKGGCGMNVWFDGSLSRQQIEEGIINSYKYGRTFTMYRYNMGFNNSTKSNPGIIADILGDWREEVVVPSSDHLTDLKVFSTWYPTAHKFPWLMTDHTYYMSVVNQNVGYNQPTNLGYYLGSDLTDDSQAWEQGGYVVTAINDFSDSKTANLRNHNGQAVYNLQGQRVADAAKGLLVIGGKKVVRR